MNHKDPGTLHDVEGTLLWMKIEGQKDPNRNVPATVFVNGLGCTLDYWDPVIERLNGVETVRYDRPGLGGSPTQQVTSPSIDVEIALLLAIVESTVTPGTPVVLVGHSYGGMLAEATIRLHPERFAGLVLVDGTDPHDHAGDDTRLEGVFAAAISLAVAIPGVAWIVGNGSERLTTFSTTIDTHGPRLTTEQRSRIASSRHIRTTMAEDLRIPGQCREALSIAHLHGFPPIPVTLLVAGDKRRLTGTQPASEWIKQNQIRAQEFGSQARLHVLSSAHLMMFDVPDAVASAIRAATNGVST